jgi:AcrR family transcriptional regulator
MTGVRERARTELTSRIKRTARRHLARDGASGLSLRAVARDLGMVSSAVYRYFPSRDDLLTALIIDAYDAFGAAAERADRTVARDDFMGRWRAVGWAAYRWSARHGAEYALIFGSPVPGYRAPDDTVGPANRFTAVLLAILDDARAAGAVPSPQAPLPDEVSADITALRGRIATGVDVDLLAAGIRAWAGLIGQISFIRFGHLHNVVHDHDAFFADALERLGHSVIRPTGTGPVAAAANGDGT